MKCPICRKDFKSDDCPHSTVQVDDRNKDNHIRKIVREEIKKYFKDLEKPKEKHSP